MRKEWIEAIGITLIGMTLTVTLASGALPRSATLATHAVGSLYNAIGTGIATVVSRHMPMNVRVQPFAGPPAWLPSMDSGDTDMGVLTSADAAASYKGILLYKRPFKGTRILVVGGTLKLGFYVPKASSMKSVADLKGKKVPSGFPGVPVVNMGTTAVLASAGLTYEDVVKVPVADLAAATQAFLEGRTEAGWHSLGSPAVEEANARVRGGVRFLPLVVSADSEKRMQDIYPGSYSTVVKGDTVTGVPQDTPLLANDIYLVASKSLGDEAAYEVVKILWEYNQELGAAYPTLKEWQRDRMVSDKAFIPYHPGAVRFFKEKGMWTKEMDALQVKLLAQ